MSCVFQNIDLPPPPPGECVPPALVAGEGQTRRVERGPGVNILEDARHSSVIYLYQILFVMDHFYHTSSSLQRFPLVTVSSSVNVILSVDEADLSKAKAELAMFKENSSH
jgi:hypothetical protein